MISLRNILIILVVWTVASPVWLAHGSKVHVPVTLAPDLREHVGGNAHSSSQEQFQGKVSPASSPSSLGASPLGKLSVDLFYTMFLLHPWPSGLAVASGWFRDYVDKSLDRGNILRVPPPATGMTPYERLRELVNKQTKSLGKYRLTTEQISLLLLAAVRCFSDLMWGFAWKDCNAEYVDLVVKDLLRQPKFAEAVMMRPSVPDVHPSFHPVKSLLYFQQPELAIEMIRVAGLNIGRAEIEGAMNSGGLEVLDKLCKFAEEHPQRVRFAKRFIEKQIAEKVHNDWVAGWPGVSVHVFRNALQPCLNIAKPNEEI